tara:strand:- start:90 stop:1469 length:1380 start_codon:yes stop_codon:yes gene_type:complete
MSKRGLKGAISRNERDSKDAGTHVSTAISLIFPASLVDPETTDFNIETLKKVKGGTGDDWIMSKPQTQPTGGFHFLWTIAPHVKGKRTGQKQGKHVRKASSNMIVSSRKFIQRHLKKEFKKEHPYSGGTKFEQGQDPARYVGGHVEASAWIQVMRKALEFGFPPERIAALRNAYQQGGMNAVDNLLNNWAGVGVAKHPEGKDGFIEKYYDDFGITYDQLQDITDGRMKQDLYYEVMVPIPQAANSEQEKAYESRLLIRAQNMLRFWADKILPDHGTGSPDLFSTVAEIIAAKLLGQKAPKYKGRNKVVAQRASSRTQRSPFKSGKKRKGQTGKAAAAKMKAYLRTTKGQFASPVALMNILNKKLPATIRDNMGHPALQNVSGRFAGSIRVQKVNPALGRSKPATIQYSYDTDPYQVFETGGKGDSRWATTARDPRILIDKSIREIAAESMMTRFVTQRL